MADVTEHARRAPRQAEAERNDRALLDAAREVLAMDGAHASVAAIAARAGVGIGSLYRRYRTKDELFQRLCELSLDQWIEAAEVALTRDDPWAGLAWYVTASVNSGAGTLGPIAGSIAVTEEMAAKVKRSDEVAEALVARAHAAGVLRPDVTSVDISLLIEQLGKSPLIEQLNRQGHVELAEAALNARKRIIAIALDGLRSGHPVPLPGYPPGDELFTARWIHNPSEPES